MSILVTKVAKQPTSVTDENFIMALTSGLSEDQIFEMAVAAAIGQATRQYNTALAALDSATEKE
jgi:alkylhydroperoxidase/carboxymuconolactone decarboxylase family protein YurZ